MFKTAIELRLMEDILISLKMGKKPEVCYSEIRALASDLMALTITKDVPTENEIENLREQGVFIEADALDEIEPSDCHHVDVINASLGAAGFDAGYANIISLNSVTVSVFYLDGEELGVVVRDVDSMVKSWNGDMIRRAKNEQ